MNKSEQLIACLEGEIAKRDEELAACRVAVENCDLFRARIAEMQERFDSSAHRTSLIGRLEIENAQLSAELAAIKAQEPVAWAGAIEYGVPLLMVEPQNWKATPLYAAPVSEAKAQGVVQWPNADEIMQMAFEEGQPADDASGYYFELEEFDLFIERLMSEVARLNAAPVHQVIVPTHEMIMAGEDQWERSGNESPDVAAIFLAMLNASPAAPAADAGLVEARKANNELVNDLHVMTNKRRQLVDALTYLRECLDPDDYMGEISMHDFIDDALAAHRAKGVV